MLLDFYAVQIFFVVVLAPPSVWASHIDAAMACSSHYILAKISHFYLDQWM